MQPFGSPRRRARRRGPPRIAVLAAGLVALSAACSRRPAAPAPDTMRGAVQPAPHDSAATPVTAGQVARAVPQPPAPGQTPRMMVYGGPLPGLVVTHVPPEPEPEPKVGYPSLGVACDSVRAISARVVEVPVSRADTTVDMDYGLGLRAGCKLTASGKFAPAPSPPPGPSPGGLEVESDPGRLGAALQRAGWAYLPHFQADGPDGESQGYRSRESLCIAHWSWDGGDDSDSTYVPSDDWDLEVDCARWEPADSAR